MLKIIITLAFIAALVVWGSGNEAVRSLIQQLDPNAPTNLASPETSIPAADAPPPPAASKGLSAIDDPQGVLNAMHKEEIEYRKKLEETRQQITGTSQ